MTKHYQPSGKFSSSSLLYFFVLSCIAFPLLGLIYAYCIWYIPIIYLNFLIAAGLGFALGFLINKIVIEKGKVRNVTLSIILGCLGGLITMYFHWAVWVDLVINAGESYGTSRIGVTVSNIKLFQVFSLAANPGALFGIIGEINDVGTWGIRNATVSGTFLSVIWVIELLIIVGMATLIPIARSGQPFCERDNDWFKELKLKAFNYIDDIEKLLSDMGNADAKVTDNLSYVRGLEQDHSLFTLYTSSHNESYLSIENNRAKTDKDGKISFDRDVVTEYLLINSSIKEQLLDKEKMI